VTAGLEGNTVSMERREWIPLTVLLVLLALFIGWSCSASDQREGRYESGIAAATPSSWIPLHAG
jgi:hypothetical protein